MVRYEITWLQAILNGLSGCHSYIYSYICNNNDQLKGTVNLRGSKRGIEGFGKKKGKSKMM